ncbi:MAG: AMP-binding protein [Alphaproteobacteria bacterium]|nr:AMP-binding protein [Alphaproteobacteria bacterium]MCL2890046.1 AMP-binding protein [Alphaproteobacteria bacterium]
MMKNIYEMLHDVCSANKDSIFFVRQNETYADLLNGVKRRAVLLASRFKVKKGDVVAILSGNTPEFIKSYFAIISQGAKVLMLDTGLSKSDHENMMKHTGCKLALAQKSFFVENSSAVMFDIESLDDTDASKFVAADAVREDIAMLSFTSGSTGNPKIVGLTHNNVLSLTEAIKFYDAAMKPGYMYYGILPLYHIYGVSVNILAPLALRGSLLLQPVLNPTQFLADFQKYRPHAIPAVPRLWEIFYKKIIAGARDKRKYTLMRIILSTQGLLRAIGLGSLVEKVKKPVHDTFGGNVKLLVSAGSTLKPSVRKFFESLGFVVGDGYGLTETTGAVNFNFKFRMKNGKMHYAGPVPGNEIKIHNPDKDGIGEVWARGTSVMKGYVNNDAANAEVFEDGWFKTGDLGTLDSKGRLTIKARKKQLIVLESGKNVYPDELEDLYLQNEEILAAAVLERNVRGKVVPYAVFQVAPGTSLTMINLLIKASNLTIAPYKWVNHFAITEDELPQTSGKKIKHHEIAAMLDRGEFPNRSE